MKFGEYVSKHTTELALFLVVAFALICMALAFLCKRPTLTTNCHITMDSTQVINVKLINDDIDNVVK